jgi:outer membrane protein TolC
MKEDHIMLRMVFTLNCLILIANMMLWWPSSSAADATEVSSLPQTASKTLSLETVLSLVEAENPLLHGSRTEKLEAQGKLLEALGAFEPVLVNDLELERLHTEAGPTKTAGFNDTFMRLRHPWGIEGIAGWRKGIGDVAIADLEIGDGNQPLLGIILPLLRGLGMNPDRATLEKSKLADREALLNIQFTRQDLYLGAATQYWKWVAARKGVVLRQQALEVAKIRLRQLSRQAEEGAVAEFNVIEANQEVQRRLESVIRAQREVEQEQFKLSLFVWNDGSPLDLDDYQIPDFPAFTSLPDPHVSPSEVRGAQERRPEVLQVELEAAMNQIDLDLAKNNFLPELTADAEPSRKPGDFVLGLGYRFGLQFKLPFLLRGARGEKLQAEAKGMRLMWALKYRMQEVAVDIDNAYSALTRAEQRIDAASEALNYARSMVKGETTRFRLGATSLLLVNLRERNAIGAEIAYIKAQADFHQARALYQWATGHWTQPIAQPRTPTGFLKGVSLNIQ